MTLSPEHSAIASAEPYPSLAAKSRMIFICESGVDVRMIEGLGSRFRFSILVRPAFGDHTITWPYEGESPVVILRGPAGRIGFALYTFKWLLTHGRNFDVALVQNYGLAALAANLARLVTGLRTLLLICSPNIEYFQCRRKKGGISLPGYIAGIALLRICRALNSLFTERYIVLSQYLAGVVAENGRDRSAVIPIYGVNTERFRPVSPEQKAALRERLGLPKDIFIIFFSSRIAPEKDTESLLRAACILLERGHEFLLLNLSGGYQAFLQKAESDGLRNWVRAMDAVHPVHDLPAYYQAADLCVQVSLEEGLGLSPLEALACEVPVIATDVGGLRETVLDGETGLRVPVGDAQALADKIAYAMDHRQQMLAMARRGRKMIQQKYEAERCFDALADLVERTTKTQRHKVKL
jgi:glycosyltransferase involved in cell wall biosynthesis